VVIFTDGELAEDRLLADDLTRYRVVVLPGCWWLTARQADVLQGFLDGGGRVVVAGELGSNLDPELTRPLLAHERTSRSELTDTDALQPLGAQVEVGPELGVNLHRLDDAAVAVHLVNYNYDSEVDAVRVHRDVELRIRLDVPRSQGVIITPGRGNPEVAVTVEGNLHTVRLDEVGAYAVVVLHDGQWSLGARPGSGAL
jgi:hypothetical protein